MELIEEDSGNIKLKMQEDVVGFHFSYLCEFRLKAYSSTLYTTGY